jgi:hypothetical protein
MESQFDSLSVVEKLELLCCRYDIEVYNFNFLVEAIQVAHHRYITHQCKLLHINTICLHSYTKLINSPFIFHTSTVNRRSELSNQTAVPIAGDVSDAGVLG